MKRIKFDAKTVEEIRQFAAKEGCTIKDICNRFTLKQDTVRRLLWENKIVVNNSKCENIFEVSEDQENIVCSLFENTNTRLQDIAKESKLLFYQVQSILDKHYTKEQQNTRKSKLYRASKLGHNNPMLGKKGPLHHNYKGEIDDGNGYLMIRKPDWYEGRKGNSYVFVHTLVMCEALGLKRLPKGFTIHHIDGNKHNNDINNLALITNSGHSKLHGIIRRLCKVQRLSRSGVGNDEKSSTQTPNND